MLNGRLSSTKTYRVISQRRSIPIHKQELISQVAKAAEVLQQKAAAVITEMNLIRMCPPPGLIIKFSF
jgi:hypothetical protein